MHFSIHAIRGVNRVVKEDFDPRTAKRIQSSSYFRPQGITVYGNDPRLYSLDQLKVLKKISREFRIDLGSGHLDFSQAGLLADTTLVHTSEFLVGNGFPFEVEISISTHDSVVFNQYNPRSLIDSLQEGYGK